MSITVLPKTRLGRWSVGIAVACLLIFTAWQIGLAWERHLDALHRYPYPAPPRIPVFPWPLLSFAAAVSCIGSFFTGLISIIGSKERSIVVFLVTLAGLLVLFFLFGQLMFPRWRLL